MRVWITAPSSGGRSALGAPLAAAFSSLGCDAGDMSLVRIRLGLDRRGKTDEALWLETIAAFWRTYLVQRPDLLVDISPLPAEIIREARKNGTRTVLWLLEDVRKPEFAFLLKAAADYDAVFTYQNDLGLDPLCRYLPWGASRVVSAAPEPVDEVLLHGTATAHRIAFAREIIAAGVLSCAPLSIVGPKWKKAGFVSAVNLSVEDRWTSEDETARLMAGRMVLVPLSSAVNAVPPRLWDALGAGACVLSETIPVMRNHLEPGKHFEVWSTPKEAVQKIRRLMKDRPARAAMIREALTAVREQHTLAKRCQACTCAH